MAAQPSAPGPNSALMTSASLAHVRKPRRGPLVALLAIDAGLAISGGLLLRAGLAEPAAAAATTAPAAPKAAPAAAPSPAPTAPSSAAPSTEPTVGASASPLPADAPSPAAAPTSLPSEAAAAKEEPPAAAPPAPASAPVEDKPTGSGRPTSSRDKKRSGGKGEGPVDPYARELEADLVRQLQEVFEKSQARFDSCLSTSATIPERVTVTLTIVGDGSLSNISFVPTISDLSASCLRSQLVAWRLRRPNGPPIAATRAIVFRPPR